MRWLIRGVVALLFLAAASLFLWLDTLRAPEPAPEPDAAMDRLPDYYLTAFRIERYRGEGRPRQTLAGERLEHFPESDTAVVRQPRVDYDPEGGPSWRIRSDHGTYARGLERLQLDGSVRLHRPPAPDAGPLTLLTPYLVYEMDAEIARTDRSVRVVSPGSRVDAVGMTAYLQPERVELHHDVRARHDPALAAPGDADD